MHKKGFIAQQALDEQRANQHARAGAKLREDEARLAKTEMRAPFPGVAGLRQVSEGAYVAAGTDIARLEKIDQLKLDFRVPETFLAQLKAGQPVRIAVDAYPGGEFRGAIYAIEPAIDEQTRTRAGARARRQPRPQAAPRHVRARAAAARRAREGGVDPRGGDRAARPGQLRVPRQRRQGRAGAGATPACARWARSRSCKGLAGGDLVVTEGTQRIGPGSAVSVMPGEAGGVGAGQEGMTVLILTLSDLAFFRVSASCGKRRDRQRPKSSQSSRLHPDKTVSAFPAEDNAAGKAEIG